MDTAIPEFIRGASQGVPGALASFLSKIGGLEVLFNQVLAVAIRGGPPGLFHRALKIIFSSDDGFSLITSDEVVPMLLSGLVSEHASVREILLTYLQQWLLDEKKISYLATSDFFATLLGCLRDTSVTVATAADTMLQQMCSSNTDAMDRLIASKDHILRSGSSSEEKETLIESTAHKRLCRLRGLALLVHVLAASERTRIMLLSTVVHAWLHDVASPDLKEDALILINFLELGKELVAIPKAFQIVIEQDGIRCIIALLPQAQVSQDMFDGIIRCAVLNFLEAFAEAAQAQNWDEWTQLEDIAPVLRCHLDQDDPALQRASINTIATIGCSPVGLQLVKDILPQVPRFLWHGNEEIKIAALNSISAVLSCHTDIHDNQNESKKVLCNLWQAVGETAKETHSKGSSTSHAWKFAKSPFPEVSEAGWRVLLSLTHHSWGIVDLCTEPGCLEYLLDRRSTSDKKTAVLRFQLIDCALKHPATTKYTSATMVKQLQEFLRAGVLGPAPTSAVAATEFAG